MNLVCIQAKNSVDFVYQVFKAYDSRELFAIADCENAAEFKRLRGIEATGFIATQSGGGWLNLAHSTYDSIEPAQIVFTSGTEGKPKAIVLAHSGLKNVVDRINVAMEVDDTICEYIGVPVYHSFGLGRCRAVSAAGGKAFIPENGFDLKEIVGMLADGQVNALSAVPSLLRILLDSADLFVGVADKLMWIEIGSQYMSADEKRRLRDLFPKAKIVQHYGLTEASRTSLLRIDQVEGKYLESVGVVDPDIHLQISEEGRLSIKGPHVALGLLSDNEITPLANDEGYFETSDLAAIDDGYLYFKGRADDVINCGGVKFDPANIEAELNRGYEESQHVYISRIPDEYRGDGILLNLLDSTQRPIEAVIDEVDALLSKNNIHAKSSIKSQIVTEFPKTKTNKIKRKELSNKFIDTNLSNRVVDDANTIRAVYCKIFNTSSIDLNETFNSLGGDSLTYVRASVEIEKRLGYLPDAWENIALSKLEKLKGTEKRSGLFSKIEAGILLRCLAIIAVVSHHAGVTLVKGGATLLMIIAGYNYMRFQLPKQLAGDTFSVVKSLFINILAPYWLFLGLYLTLKGHPINAYDMLLISSSIFPKLDYVPFQVWFIQVLIQSIILFSLPLLFKITRDWIADNQTLYIVLFALFLFAARVVDGMLDFGTVYNLQGGQFSWVAWLFGLGAIIFVLQGRHKILLLSVAVIASVIFYSPDYSRILFISLGTALLLWLPNIKVPRFSLSLIQAVSASSLFIYMLHGRAPIDSLTSEWQIDLIRIGVGILIGVVGYTLYNFGLTILAKIYQRFSSEV